MNLTKNNDTIVAISSGIGAISIIRLSGKDSLNLALLMLKKKELSPRVATLCSVYDEQKDLIDKAILIYYKAPFSFTGEDIVEFQCHGGVAVSSIILESLIKFGARLAKAGEFSKRAVLNDKMDLTQAEAAAKMIDSKSTQSVKILAKHLKGELLDYTNKLRDELIETLAFVEVGIDYAEEDLPQSLEDEILQKLDKIYNNLSHCIKRTKQNEGLINGFKVAIVGKPNVGKSSLLNSILSYERAIVSEFEGTTRDTVEEELKVGAHLVKIIDTAGIRNTDEKVEQIGIQRSKKAIEEADIIIALFDNSRKCDAEDKEILQILSKEKDKKIFYVLNKNDLNAKFDKNLLKEPLFISCKMQDDKVFQNLKAYLDTKTSDEGIILSTKRQQIAITNALEAINRSKSLLNQSEIELFAFELNEAISEISSITKIFLRDEILDKMFSSFCVGK